MAVCHSVSLPSETGTKVQRMSKRHPNLLDVCQLSNILLIFGSFIEYVS